MIDLCCVFRSRRIVNVKRLLMTEQYVKPVFTNVLVAKALSRSGFITNDSTGNFNTASFWPELLTAVYDSLRCSSVIGQFESDKATYADAISNCQEFEDFTASDIERAQSEMHSPEFKNGLEEDKNFWWEKNSLVDWPVGDPLSGFGSNRYMIFWTQMTRFNQTHFHNKTSIFQQHSMFNIGDFQDHVLSNEHGRLRYFKYRFIYFPPVFWKIYLVYNWEYLLFLSET